MCVFPNSIQRHTHAPPEAHRDAGKCLLQGFPNSLRPAAKVNVHPPVFGLLDSETVVSLAVAETLEGLQALTAPAEVGGRIFRVI